METSKTRVNRIYGYDILINNFETILRQFIVEKIFLVNFGDKWKENIPNGVWLDLNEIKQEDIEGIQSISDFFEELNFLHLKDILVYSNNYKLARSFFGELSKEKFTETMDEVNIIRRKIAHAKSTFSDYDLMNLIEYIKLLSQGNDANEVTVYLKNEAYKNATEIPLDFFEEFVCQNNLPPENYDLDGGFVGREKEIKTIRKFINSEQDRIVTITGAGGVGKTAIALKIAYTYLADPDNQFEAIIWFSAKTDKLTEQGIIPLTSEIRSDEQLIYDILKIVDPLTLQQFNDAKVNLDAYKNHLNNIFSSQKCLLIIDNLETILKNDEIISFIKEINRPSQVLITSRKGLGEIERRFPITDMPVKEAIKLFRLISKERNRLDLVRLSDEYISTLVTRVKCYPLLIKWSIGQVCLGKDPESAFAQIFDGSSEIAIFSFNDVFKLLSSDSKTMLFSMIVYGDKPISKYVAMHLSNFDDDQFEDAVKELILTSFLIPEIKEADTGSVTEFSMLGLTRGFIEKKLDEDEKTRGILSTRYYHLSQELQEFEKSQSSYSQSLFSLGIKTPEEKVAFNYVKTAKNFFRQNDFDNAEKYFEQATKVAPLFSYVFSEFSKFEFKRGHFERGLELAKKAVEISPENYHAWFSYGIFLRKNQQLEESVKSLIKAKELNPNHLPIYNELGRAYTFLGEYEKAENEFVAALKEEKYPNYRHIIMTLQFKADNYRRWSESFRERKDLKREIECLEKAFSTVLKALDVDKKDIYIWNLYRDICKNLGIALWKDKNFTTGRPYLEKCLQVMHIENTDIHPSKKMISEACYFLAALSIHDDQHDPEQVKKWIEMGLKNCLIGSMQYEKLKGLENQLIGERARNETKIRQIGIIRFIDLNRKFGVIDCEGNTYIFFKSGFRNKEMSDDPFYFKGKEVSFKLRENVETTGKPIAVDIIFL
ncbi:tetratricopeptide repeat protein [Methanoregula sp. UBA64]|jgi:LuxR family transcriptional regulator, glucitol operon activator|uniref:tetratricopeptide repeat protein n=1 Tax=Methanoregula sp. UBA64 TaxID=1915554 RepID=UPI0025E8611E|nr:ATP-binding protein [Methanoregula sp. UBA64]